MDIGIPKEVALLSPPSVSDGTMSVDEERRYRAFGCELICECGIQLELPQVAVATAQVFFQRFFHRCSFRDMDAHHVVMGAIFLAGKVEECQMRMRPVISVCHAAMLRRQGLAITPIVLGGETYTEWKMALIRSERLILKELGFQVYQGVSQEHAHKFLLYFVRVLNGDAPLAQRAWNFLNDSLRLDLCVRYSAEALACAAIFLAAKDLSFPLPESVPWYEVLGAKREVLDDICEAITSLYNSSDPIGWLPSKKIKRDAEI